MEESPAEIHDFGTIENSIVVSSTRPSENTYAWKYCWWHNAPLPGCDDGAKFLYNGKNNGVIKALKNGDNTLSTYERRYDAAGEVELYILGVPAEPISHPLIGDNNEGIGHEKNSLGDDGELAEKKHGYE